MVILKTKIFTQWIMMKGVIFLEEDLFSEFSSTSRPTHVAPAPCSRGLRPTVLNYH